ncbi:MAG: carbonic anhydrase [Acidobacteriota bacterium]|jgi:carbonic anhydrase|nr:carbonic anhydrase [Acidobacteriota bacterium]
MSVVDEALKANKSYTKDFAFGDLPLLPPALKLAVVACMDARMDIFQILRLKPGDAHVIRNAGGIITVDAMRSLLISQHLLGTKHVMIINHTECGMQTFQDEKLLADLQQKSGTDTIAPTRFHAFSDLEKNVRQQIKKVRSHPWVSKEITVRGFIYDVETGKLHEVAPSGRKKAQKR